jgi:predicted DCC family thiol-disulfide oxidoreductase YuxK
MIPTDTASDPTPNPTPPRGRWVLIYDAHCGFCRWSLRRVLALDRAGRLHPVALGTPEADSLLADLTPAARAASWHLVSPDGMRTSAGEAAPPLLRLLKGGRLPAALLERMPRLTDRAYRWVAEHRSWLGRFTR